MGWRDIVAGDEPRKERKFGKEPDVPVSVISGFSGISLGVGTPTDPRRDDLSARIEVYAKCVGGFTEADKAEALEIALRDPAGWLEYLNRQTDKMGSPAVHVPPSAASSQTAWECGRCWNFELELAPHWKSGRRQFQYRCTRGHRILRCGFGMEDVLLASASCDSYDDRAPK